MISLLALVACAERSAFLGRDLAAGHLVLSKFKKFIQAGTAGQTKAGVTVLVALEDIFHGSHNGLLFALS